MKPLTILLVSSVLISGTAMGQNDRHDEVQDSMLTTLPAQAVSVGSLIGSNVLSRADQEPIGEVKDIVINREGRPVAVIVATGGFLGMGDKNVALGWSHVDVMPYDENGYVVRRDPVEGQPAEVAISTREHHQSTHDRDWGPDDYVLVVNVSQEVLEDAPEFDSEDWDMR